MTGDPWPYIGGLREDLGRAESRIAELEEGLRDALNRIHVLEDRQPDYAAEDDLGEGYACSVCGDRIGIFQGHGLGWHHYRGDGTAASPYEIYDAGHEATFAAGPDTPGGTT